jgi:hypothetical protein
MDGATPERISGRLGIGGKPEAYIQDRAVKVRG